MMKKTIIIAIFVFLTLGFVLAVGNGSQNGTPDTTEPSEDYREGNFGDIPRANSTPIEGGFVSENGQTYRIEKQSENRLRIESNGIKAECEDCDMTQEMIQNRTRLNVQMSNGVKAQIKVMPDVAAEKAIERLRLKVCSTENNCTLELKEVGQGNQTQMAYEVQVERHSRILGIFSKKMQVKAEVATENGEVLDVDKPWWAFLASEPEEE